MTPEDRQIQARAALAARGRQERVKPHVRAVLDAATLTGQDFATLVYVLANEHRTHQQTLMRFCVAYVQEMALHEHADARNAASVALAKKLVAAMASMSSRDTYLPFV